MCVRVLIAPQMLLKAEKSHKIDHREVYMMHRLDIQRLSGKKSKPEAWVSLVPRPRPWERG